MACLVENAVTGEAEPTKGWHFSTVTGEFIVNYSGVSQDGVTQYDKF